MATHIGNEGVVLVGNTTVGEVRSFEVTENAEVADDSALTDAWDTHILGSKNWTASVTCSWDETDGGQGNLTIGNEVTLNLYPEGNAAADTYYTGNATVTTLSHSVGRNEVQEVSFDCTGKGALTITTV